MRFRKLVDAAVAAALSVALSVVILAGTIGWTFFIADTVADKLLGMTGIMVSGLWCGIAMTMGYVIDVAEVASGSPEASPPVATLLDDAS